MTQDEIKSTIMDKYPNLTEKQYNLIVHDFWNAIRYYLVNPTEARGGILLYNLLSFDISDSRLKKYQKISQIKHEAGTQNPYTKLEPALYEKLIEQKRKYARQKSKSNQHEQPVGEISEGGCSIGEAKERNS